MDVRNCRKCGRVFNYVAGPPICPACKEANESKFQDVKKYVQEHKSAGVQEIAEACDVQHGQINQWIREERLVFADDSPIGIGCEGCGAMIKTGRYCEKCKVDIARGLTSAIKRPEFSEEPKGRGTKDNPRMRFLDN